MNIARNMVLFLTLAGCGSSPDALKAKEDAAEASYAAALLRCVDKSTTLQDAHACEDRVDIEWKITVKVTDGGAK